MLFAIDHGNSAIKTPNFTFASGVTDYPVKPPVETDVLEFGGTYWILSGDRIPYMRDKTKDDRFFVLTLFAIAKELRQRGMLQPMVEAEVAVGLPPEHYELRERFAKYFKRGNVQFVFNDTPICVMFRQILVYPQAYAAVVPRAQAIRQNPRTFVVDIGGFTTDVLLLRGIQPDMQFCRSLELGVIPMSNGIIGCVSALHDIKIDEDHIADVIQGKPTILPDDVQETIRSTVKSYAAGILDKLRELQVDLRATPAIFIGGGAALFRPFIEESDKVAKAEFISDTKANAIGYGMLATPSSASWGNRRSVVILLRNDKFRFSLQWGNNTVEKVQAGVLLEKLGKRKSDFIVLAITEYIQRHPEVVAPEASLNISVTYHPLQPNEQLMEEIRTLARKVIEEHLAKRHLISAGDGILLINGEIPSEVPADIDDQDLDAMVDSLKLFDI